MRRLSMNFNKHFNLKDAHAFLGASQHSWLNYDDEKLMSSYYKFQATIRGTKLHEMAKMLIEMKQELPRTNDTLNMYVNDAIFWNMVPEQILFYSRNCFGTADAISYDNGLLRIHDLKTGTTPVSMDQLKIYASLFCLEYDVALKDIDCELRIYQNNRIIFETPTMKDLAPICDKIIHFDELLNKIRLEEGL